MSSWAHELMSSWAHELMSSWATKIWKANELLPPNVCPILISSPTSRAVYTRDMKFSNRCLYIHKLPKLYVHKKSKDTIPWSYDCRRCRESAERCQLPCSTCPSRIQPRQRQLEEWVWSTLARQQQGRSWSTRRTFAARQPSVKKVDRCSRACDPPGESRPWLS